MDILKEISQNGNLVDEKFIVEYEKEFYDITDFMLKHPGGINTLSGYNHKNIEQKFRSVEHSSAARYLLNDYKISRHKAEPNDSVSGSVRNVDDSLEVSCKNAAESRGSAWHVKIEWRVKTNA